MPRVELRWRRQTYQVEHHDTVASTAHQLLVVEWDVDPSSLNLHDDNNNNAHALFEFTINCSLYDASPHSPVENVRWTLLRSAREVFDNLPAAPSPDDGPPPLPSSSATLLEIQSRVLHCANQHAILQLFEVSQWTFNTLASEYAAGTSSTTARIKEGALEKATGGYESYNRSRWNVLWLQLICILVAVGIWLALGHWLALYLCFAVISLLSLAHWSYYRLNAIDATCVVPCLLLPPVGPMIVLVWTVLMCLFQRGKSTKWFVLRPSHLEFYSAWAMEGEGVSSNNLAALPRSSEEEEEDGQAAKLTDLVLLDSSTRVYASGIFPHQFICQTPFRILRLWASSKRERDDWVDKIQSCLDVKEAEAAASAAGGISSALTPMRSNVPATFLIDGKDTFAAMKQALLGAKHEIFIAGWMLSPELFLDHGDCVPSYWETLPVSSSSPLFHARSTTSTTVYVDTRYEYVADKEVSLAVYEIIVRDRHLSSELGIIVEGYDNATQTWIVVDEQRNVGWRNRDVGEPVRFRIDGRPRAFARFGVRFVHWEQQQARANDNDDDVDLESGSGGGDGWTRLEHEQFECGGVVLLAHTETSLQRCLAAAAAASPSASGRWWWHRAWAYWFPFGDDDDDDHREPLGEDDDGDGASTTTTQESRLDRIIAQKVKEGVKCYIIIYRDMDMFLSNASFYAKRKLLLKSAQATRSSSSSSSTTTTTTSKSGGVLQIMRHAPPSRATGSVQHLFSCSLSKGNTWWSHHEKLVCVDQSTAFVGGLDLAYGRYDDCEHNLWDQSASVWRGKDYYNARAKDFDNLGLDPYSDSVDRNLVPRMPWHDVHCQVGGAAAGDLARYFIGRWNAERKESTGGGTGTGGGGDGNGSLRHRCVLVPRYGEASSTTTTTAAAPSFINIQCQVLRSVGPWSSPSQTESSILHGYIQLIAGAKRFIYIEQQFFSSSLAGRPVKNAIALALVDRIARACMAQERFRVVIVLPVLPAFEGEVTQNSSSRSVLHWNLRTIRGMRQRLLAQLGYMPPATVLGFYSLRRAQANSAGVLATEPIYVHSKLLIVDDKSAIAGSANLNDRSMLGSRDSELAVMVTSSEEFVRGLRSKLFEEHCGGDGGGEDDGAATSKWSWRHWDQVATSNTDILERAFDSVPRDAYVTLAHTAAASASHVVVVTPGNLEARAEILAGGLRGHLVRFPIHFLSQEPSLLPQITRGEREGAIPFENFT